MKASDEIPHSTGKGLRITKNRIINRITLSDIILLIVLIVVVGVSFRSTSRFRKDEKVFIYKANVLWGQYELDRNQIIQIDEHNSIEIKDTKVRMLHADCPDKRCVKMGFVRNVPIICLPNQVLVEIRKSEQERRFILH